MTEFMRQVGQTFIVLGVMYTLVVLGIGFLKSWKPVLHHIVCIIYNLAVLGVIIWFCYQPVTVNTIAWVWAAPMLLPIYAAGVMFANGFDDILD